MFGGSIRSRWGGNDESHGQWMPVSSSNIAAIAFNELDESLFVQFHSGGVYEYLNCPEYLFNEFLNAPSKGKFFYWRIKDKFEWIRHR